mgnify:CR=1 FL=1
MTKNYIRIYDTTLRDGEQTPGVSLTLEDKMQIAESLSELGVDIIEAGFPQVSKGEFDTIKQLAASGFRADIIGLARVDMKDIEAVADTGLKHIHLFIATSDIHLKHKLKISKEEAIKQAVKGVEYAKKKGMIIEFSAEDATRTEIGYLKQVFKAVVDAGADRIDVPDTVGTTTPEKFSGIIKEIKNTVDVPISVHCHDDFGLSVSNSIAGITAGASSVHSTINGIGERAGNTSLEEIVMALHHLYNMKTGINTKKIYNISRLVSRLTGVIVQPNKAIVGANAFGHESGIHTHGVLTKPLTYEPISPELVGRQRWIQAGKHSGSHGLVSQLKEIGVDADKNQVKEILNKVKEMGDKGKTLTDNDLRAISETVTGLTESSERHIELQDVSVMTGLKSVPAASVRIIFNGKTYTTSETGVGPIDSALKSIQKITGNLANIRIQEFRMEALTGGSDALAEVSIKVGDDQGNVASSRFAGEDIVIASVQAMIDGINRLLQKREQKEKQK